MFQTPLLDTVSPVSVLRSSAGAFLSASPLPMNLDERFESFVLPDGVKKIQVKKDKKRKNTITVVIEREDHTVGNVLCAALQAHPDVEFAAYTAPHPLIPRVEVTVTTDGTTSPESAVSAAFESIIGKSVLVENAFSEALHRAG
ncbi:MAG: DNA-directed RNA polymerases I and III subunit RPAC2 [Amphiamblys sp. WSBS2006]|nr:MAG: DNA-directed RNA polymerases I and III subunit RPAC2 [Amphiamblys sp. WSBS2006]